MWEGFEGLIERRVYEVMSTLVGDNISGEIVGSEVISNQNFINTYLTSSLDL